VKYSLTKHYKFKLEENEVIQTDIEGRPFATRWMRLGMEGKLTVLKGYCHDGSSIPFKRTLRVLSLWIYDADRYCKEASLGHDALCQAIREGNLPKHLKEYVDSLYRSMCIVGGLPKRRANARYKALRKAGDLGITPEKNPRNRIYDTKKLDK
jgi:hypothetical protein